MPYASQRDRTPTTLEISRAPWPGPPLNVFMKGSVRPGVFDLTWDNPGKLARNSRFVIFGVNIYRSFDSEFGPYQRVTEFPVGSGFWRDLTNNVLVQDEDVSNRWVLFGITSGGNNYPRYVFKTLRPIVKAGSQMTYANAPSDVQVFVDGTQVPVLSVSGQTGEVEIDIRQYPDVAKQNYFPTVVPSTTSKVTCSYRYTKDLLRTDLAQKIFWRFTTVGLPVEASLSVVQASDLIETPIEWASTTSSYEIEKLDYIWREAVRRNRFILEEGGERVQVFLRKQVGITCPCIPDDIHKQPINDDPTCFVPGTLIRTELGWKPIETIVVGDRVLSSDGGYHPVKSCLQRHYLGKIVFITSSVNTSPIGATTEHPFFVLRGHHKSKGKCGPKCDAHIHRGDGSASARGLRVPKPKLLPSGRWWARVQIGGSRGVGRVSLGTYASLSEAKNTSASYKMEHWSPAHVMEWDLAENIVVNDWLASQWFHGLSDVDKIQVPPECKKNSKHGPRRSGSTEFTVDLDFLWMLGLYLAEGSSGKGTLCFSLHSKEKEYADKIRTFFNRYGYSSSYNVDGNKASVVVYGRNLSEWFPKWLGRKCYNKRIPQEFMSMSSLKTWALIQGIHDGDGSKRHKEITQTSEILALQLVELLHRVGEQPLVRRQKSSALTPKGNVRKLAYCVSWAEETHTHTNRKGRWIFNQRLLSKVRKTSESDYCGPVYNLEVDGDPTYVANGILVHNCFGTGIVGGYDGPFDIIIAPDDSEKRISQKESGRTVEHTYETWTGPTPLLSQRDFLVKINGERYSIGAVRIPSNRGMVLQQHFTVGHFDERDIRYQVPTDKVVPNVLAFQPSGPEHEASSEVTDNPNIPEDRQVRGRSLAWQNTTY